MHIVISRKQSIGLLLLLFVLSVLLRLPNLNRPLSKHHEFNTAVVLSNIISWRQAGGGNKFHYTPIFTFQNPGDKVPEKAVYLDSAGNRVYLSYGAGLFLIPYAFFQLFHLPPQPIYLQVLNLGFNLAAILLLFYLFETLLPPSLPNRYACIVAACTIFMFSPGILWFFGNGYINIDIMMPFVAGLLALVLPMLQSARFINPIKLSLVAALVIILCYIDWFVVFICAVAVVMAALKRKQSSKYNLLIFVLMIAVALGIALVFFQFSSYLGWAAVAEYWKERFTTRSYEENGSALKMTGLFILHFFTSYLPSLLLLLITYLLQKKKRAQPFFSEQELLFIRLYACSLFLYNFIFFNWSSQHEFSIIPVAILPAYLGARFLMQNNPKIITGIGIIFIAAATMQYYFINRPGNIARDGTRYDRNKTFGEKLKQVPTDYTIFMHTESNPMAEYYAGRNFTYVNDYLNAKKYMLSTGIKKAVWVEQDSLQLKEIVVIK